jgi:hypothetical protein
LKPCRQAVDLTQLSKYAKLPIPYSSCRYAVIGRPDFPLAFGISTAVWPEIIWGDDRDSLALKRPASEGKGGKEPLSWLRMIIANVDIGNFGCPVVVW